MTVEYASVFFKPVALDDISMMSSAYISKSKTLPLVVSSTPDMFVFKIVSRLLVNRLKSKGLKL